MNEKIEHLPVLRKLFDISPQGVFVVSLRNATILDANPAGCAALGFSREKLIGRDWSEVSPLLHAAAVRHFDTETYRLTVIDFEAADPPRESPAPPCDALTGLATRDALARFASLEDRQPHARLALMFIDLDDFKRVNDTLGHLAGDRVLQTVAKRLAENVRSTDLVVRYGGDEFIVIIECVRRRRDLVRRARRLSSVVQKPIALDDREIRLTASIGIARRAGRQIPLEKLTAEADRAMYRAKQLSRRAIEQPLVTSDEPQMWHFADVLH